MSCIFRCFDKDESDMETSLRAEDHSALFLEQPQFDGVGAMNRQKASSSSVSGVRKISFAPREEEQTNNSADMIAAIPTTLNYQENEDICQAAFDGRLDIVNQMLNSMKARAKSRQLAANGMMSVLHCACACPPDLADDTTVSLIVETLLAAGAEAHVLDPRTGRTPLHLACMNVRRAAAKVLLDFGHAHKSLLVRDHENKTPLEVVGSAYRHSPNQGAIPHHLLVDLANREANLQKLLADAAREQKVRSNSTVH